MASEIQVGDVVSYRGHRHVGHNVYTVVGDSGRGSFDIKLTNGLEAGAPEDQAWINDVVADDLVRL